MRLAVSVCQDRHSIGLDTATWSGIVMITHSARRRPEVQRAGKARQQTLKGRSPPRRGHPEPDTREGSRSQVPRRGILRSARCRPGQVRDAAPRFDRQRARKRCRRRIRGLKADLLPSQGELRRGRHCRVGSQEARPTGSVQGPGRSIGVPPGTSSLAHRFARASWCGWFGKNSTSMCTQGRSSVRSVEKKRRASRRDRSGMFAAAFRHRRRIRDPAHGHAR